MIDDALEFPGGIRIALELELRLPAEVLRPEFRDRRMLKALHRLEQIECPRRLPGPDGGRGRNHGLDNVRRQGRFRKASRKLVRKRGGFGTGAAPAVLVVAVVRVRRELRSRARVWMVYPLLGLYGLGAIGGGYQTIRESIDRRHVVAPGQLVDVGGHRLHLNCAGSGAPTVILESGLGATAASWTLISTAIARDTRVCAYDRAGRGWSDPSPASTDGVAVATDLHVLLERAHVPGPFVLVGHSSGANYVRIFAGRYPEQVAGMVLLDGQPAEAFEDLPAFPAFYARYRRVFAVLPSLARLGVGRLVSHNGFDNLPEPARSMERLSHSSARLFRSLRDEFMELPTSLQQARSFQSIGGRPLMVVTAAVDAMAGWLPLQEEMATLSTNSSHRVVPFTHDGLVSSEAGAQVSSEAIRDVVRAVRSGVSLKKS
jgi:pimeloyl-ACP methyl ester carboxylesterase